MNDCIFSKILGLSFLPQLDLCKLNLEQADIKKAFFETHNG